MNQHRLTQCERVYEVLADGRWHSTRELLDKTGITRMSGRIYDLKKKHHVIQSRTTTIDGVRWEEYRLVKQGERPEPSALYRELQAIKEKARLEREGAARKRLKGESMPRLFLFDNSPRKP